MLLFLCVKNVVMDNRDIAFYEGKSYQFTMDKYGDIHYKNTSLAKFHSFSASRWPEYFKYNGAL